MSSKGSELQIHESWESIAVKYHLFVTLFLNSLAGHMLLNGQDHEIVHLGQSLSCFSAWFNSLNLVKESCNLEDE